jgi:DNA-directed RNA polymerase alpha subunit
MHEMAASNGLIRQELFAHQPPAKRTPVAGSGLDFRTMNCLLAEGIEYVEDAQQMLDRELLNISNFGRVSLARLRAWVPSGA